MMSQTWSFWSRSPTEVLQQLRTVPQELFGDEACRRHLREAHLLLKPKSRLSTYELLFRRFSPIILILLAAAGLAFFPADPTDTAIILMIVP
jgi:hypothetical protein